jgi:hypothetical protein
MMPMAKPEHPSKPVRTKEELEQLLLAGLDSGEPRPFTREDWDALRRRALANTEVRKSGS